MYLFCYHIKLFNNLVKNILYFSSRRTPIAKSTASAAAITFLFKFFQFPFCFRCQVRWHFNLYSCIFITMYRRMIHGNNTFSSQTDFRSGLCSRFDITENIAVNGMNLCFSAKYCCCKRNIDRCINISAFPSVARFILNIYFQ